MQTELKKITQINRKQKIKIAEYYLKDNLKPSEIAEEFGLDQQSLRSYLFNAGLTAKRKELDNRVDKQIEQKSDSIIEYKTHRQLEYFANLQDRTETLTEKALDMADNAEGASELNTALSAVKSSVGLFSEASSVLGHSLASSKEDNTKANTYNFFMFSGDEAAALAGQILESRKTRIETKEEKIIEI